MSRWSAFLDRVDQKLDRDLEREPDRSKPARPSLSRYYFMAAAEYTCCGGLNECTCPKEGE